MHRGAHRADGLAGGLLAVLARHRLVEELRLVDGAAVVAVDADPVHLAAVGDLRAADHLPDFVDDPPPERGPVHNGMMHRSLIPLLGLMLGELWRLGPLATACATDGRYAFLLTAKPLNLIGGVGSPPNAMAIK